MICEYCEQDKSDVFETLDPFGLEISEEEVKVVLCEDCYYERALEI